MAKKASADKKSGPARTPGMKIKKGDHVIVIAGRDNGREGTVIAAYPDKQRLLIQGVNMIKKNKKVDYQGRSGLRDSKQGGIIHQEALIHVSNVLLIDPDTKKPARAGYRRGDDNKKVRISRPSGKDI
jgi:large subunit ribosomal protein L24